MLEHFEPFKLFAVEEFGPRAKSEFDSELIILFDKN